MIMKPTSTIGSKGVNHIFLFSCVRPPACKLKFAGNTMGAGLLGMRLSIGIQLYSKYVLVHRKVLAIKMTNVLNH